MSYKDQAGGTFEQAKGKVKEKIGEASGNERMRTEGMMEKESGKLRRDAGRIEEKMKGRGEVMTGKAKEMAGRAMDDEDLENEGQAEQVKGDLRKKLNR